MLDLGWTLALSVRALPTVAFSGRAAVVSPLAPLLDLGHGSATLLLGSLFGRPEQVGGVVTVTTFVVVSAIFGSIASLPLARHPLPSGQRAGTSAAEVGSLRPALAGVFAVGQLLLPAGCSGVVANLLDAVMNTSLYAAVGIAILRYRLYDIDVVINRALVYGALTASVVGITSLSSVPGRSLRDGLNS